MENTIMIRTLVAIDLVNLNNMVYAHKKRSDFIALREYITAGLEQPSDIYVYMSVEESTYPQGFVDFLHANGFYVVEKWAKVTEDGLDKTNVDIELALDAYDLCSTIKPCAFVLVSGDNDFAGLCRRLRRKGIYVMVASVREALGRNLRASCNRWLDLYPWICRLQDNRVEG